MIRRLPALFVLACVLALAMTAVCCAQGAPRQITLDTIRAAQHTPEQQAEIQAWAKYWCDMLQRDEASAEQVELARRELMRPLTAVVMPSPTFRGAYSGMVAPQLEPLFKNPGQPHATINAAIVLGEIASRRTLEVLIEHADVRNEPRRETRLQAAMNIEKALKKYGNDQNVIPSRDVGNIVRGVRNSAMREEDALVLRHLILALYAVGTPEARDALRDVVQEVISKIEKHEGISPLIDVYYVIASIHLVDFPRMGPAEAREVALANAPLLGRMLTVFADKWEAGHADDATMRRCGGPIRSTEALLKLYLVTSNVRAPETALRQHWEAPNRELFVNQVNQWLEPLRQPPFSR